MSANRHLEAALAYARRNIRVFPCHWIQNGACSCGDPKCGSPGKHPLTENGFKNASIDRDQIQRWWSCWPGATIAIATGAISGIVVPDIDPRHGGDNTLDTLEANHGKLPETPTVLTGGGGFHFYFRHPGGVVPNSAAKVGPGFDVRGDGGYVIAPPSVHASGQRYRWEPGSRIDELKLAPLPSWVTDLLVSPPTRPAANQTVPWPTGTGRPVSGLDLSQLAAAVSQGQRDDRLFRLACLLRRRGYPREQAEQIVVDAAGRCRPPFPTCAALRKVDSAWRYAP